MNKERTTLQNYNSYKRLHRVMFYGKFALPIIPAIIVTGVNWDEWFTKQGVSMPFGIATMLIAILMAIYSYSKSENTANGNKVSPFFFIGIILSILACSFMLLASILNQMGLMFIYVVAGVFGAGAVDQVDKTLIKERVSEYKELVETNELDNRIRKKNKAKQERKDKAIKEAQKLLEKEREGATE